MTDSWELCACGHFYYEHGGRCSVTFEECPCQAYRPDHE